MWDVMKLLIPGPNSSMARPPSNVTLRFALAVMGAGALFFSTCYQSALLKTLLKDAHATPYRDLDKLVDKVASTEKQLVAPR